MEKQKGRKLIILSRREVIKINFLYWVNDRNITDISKIIGRSPPVCERHRFKTRAQYDDYMHYVEEILWKPWRKNEQD